MAFEIADLRGLGPDLSGEMVVYIESGPNPMTEEAWADYAPAPGWILNTPRAGQFDVLNVLSSPYKPTGEYTYYTDPTGFTWQAVAAVQNRAYPFDPDDYAGMTPPPATSAQAGYALATPLAGTIQYNSNDKNHENAYYAENADGTPKLQYFVTDPWGNTYILKSVNAANDTPEEVTAAVDAAVLPEGWHKSTAYLEEDTSYFPVYSGDLAHANEFRDSADSAWMQIGWGSSGVTLPAMVGDGMPIWGGNEGGLLQGTAVGDEMHGGAGDDLIWGQGGQDTIWGDAGDDTIVGASGAPTTAMYSGNFADYDVQNLADGIVLVTDRSGGEGTDTLLDVRFLGFADGTKPIGAGSSVGDPHVTTFDGLYYDIHDVGIYTLVRSTAADGMEVQVRTSDLGAAGSFNTAVGARIDGHVVLYDAAADGRILVDGEAVDLAANGEIALGDARVAFADGELTLFFPGQDRLLVQDRGDYIDVHMDLAPARAPASVEGLLGNADGDAANDLPAGAYVDGAAQAGVTGSWSIDPDHSLFDPVI